MCLGSWPRRPIRRPPARSPALLTWPAQHRADIVAAEDHGRARWLPAPLRPSLAPSGLKRPSPHQLTPPHRQDTAELQESGPGGKQPPPNPALPPQAPPCPPPRAVASCSPAPCPPLPGSSVFEQANPRLALPLASGGWQLRSLPGASWGSEVRPPTGWPCSPELQRKPGCAPLCLLALAKMLVADSNQAWSLLLEQFPSVLH